MEIVIPMWQWIMENRLSIAQTIDNWWKWRVAQIIPVTSQMRAEIFWSEFKRRYM